MTVNTVTLDKYGPQIMLQTWCDNFRPHYMLSGKRFNDEHEMLNLMLKYDGACKKKGDLLAAGQCDLNCMRCPHSIYAELETRRKWFNKQLADCCARQPKENDEWELSLVMKNRRFPRYETLHWQAGVQIHGASILDIIYESVMQIDPTLWSDAQMQFVKISRFDTDTILDCSAVANAVLREKYGVGVGTTPIPIQELI